MRSIHSKIEILSVMVLALFVTVLSTARLFSQMYYAPPQHVFIGMTHYYADFFYYLDQFYQGAHGHWLTVNNFTSEYFQPTLIYLNHLIIGKLTGLIGMESFTAYNVSVLVLKYLYFILCYIFLTKLFPKNIRYRLYAFLLFLFSTSFPLFFSGPDIDKTITPLIVFREKNTFYTRFANMPSPFLENIYFLLLLLLTYDYLKYIKEKLSSLSCDKNPFIWSIVKFTLPSVLLTVLLTIATPAKSIVYVLIFIFGIYFIKPKKMEKRYLIASLIPFVLVTIAFIFPTIYLDRTINTDPVYLNAIKWDYTEYIEQFNLLNVFGIIKSFGFLGIFYFLGLITALFKKNKLIEKLIIVGSIISLVSYFILYFINIDNLPGFRFLLISSFLFMAAISVNFIAYLEKKFTNKVAIPVIIIYLIINFVTIYHSLQIELTPLQEPDYHFTYMPNEIYEGFMFLKNLQPKDAIVLANPSTTMDLVIPGLTGKKTFTGHFLMNYNAGQKNTLARHFYYDWTDTKTAKDFLTQYHIKYIVVSKYSFTEHDKALTNSYPFLRLIFTNNSISIFTY